MIRLRIDGVECDLPAQESLPHFDKMYDLAALADPSAGRTGRAMSFRLPSSPCNDAVMGRAADIFGGSFNDRRHEAEVEVDGTVLLSGSAVLEAVEEAALPDTDGPLDAEEGAVCDGAGRVTYVVRVAGDAASWAETAARTDFDAIALDYDAVLDGDTVMASWDDSSPVKFLPVHRDSYDASYSSTSIYSPQRIGFGRGLPPLPECGGVDAGALRGGGIRGCGQLHGGAAAAAPLHERPLRLGLDRACGLVDGLLRGPHVGGFGRGRRYGGASISRLWCWQTLWATSSRRPTRPPRRTSTPTAVRSPSTARVCVSPPRAR